MNYNDFCEPDQRLIDAAVESGVMWLVVSGEGKTKGGYRMLVGVLETYDMAVHAATRRNAVRSEACYVSHEDEQQPKRTNGKYRHLSLVGLP